MPRTKKDSTITDNSTIITPKSNDNSDTKNSKDAKDVKANTSKNSKTSTKQANTATLITDTTTKTTAKPVAKIVSKTAETKAYPAVKVKVKEPEPKPKTVTRLELAQEVAKAVGRMMEITNTNAESIVAEIIQSMIDALQEGNEIEIRGFGTFRLRTRNPRIGRNPKSGARVDVPEKTIVFFKMGRDLKEFLKQS